MPRRLHRIHFGLSVQGITKKSRRVIGCSGLRRQKVVTKAMAIADAPTNPPPSILNTNHNKAPDAAAAKVNQVIIFGPRSSSRARPIKKIAKRFRTRCHGPSCKQAYETSVHNFPERNPSGVKAVHEKNVTFASMSPTALTMVCRTKLAIKSTSKNLRKLLARPPKLGALI